ncbi:HAD family hydrolase [Roseicyclus mahoneyensis]|uniref:Phosphoglycolate phosphatase n=1 Tax=Roseicyclus mahoneyensis TaxID=164332 RepID=A0A316GJV3_9RHOB|nr:HAD-IA family hydrolase [Roseicyclus mahoneyensis]PWK60815.1 phosphoglycolate phosphatase [Roseicyclus mahoneyensis]
MEGRSCAINPTRRALVLFDVDGTLLDSAPGICDIMADAFLAAGQTPPRDSDVRALIGLSLPEMVFALAADLGDDVQQKILCGYRFRYFDMVEDMDMLPVYPGAGETLHLLSGLGFAMGVATGKARRSTCHLLGEMNWGPLFHTVQCADINPSKPSPAMVYRALLETGRCAAETVLVGDSRYDMQMARAAGIRAIGVSWGYTPACDLLREGASIIAEDFDHLTDILTNIEVLACAATA